MHASFASSKPSHSVMNQDSAAKKRQRPAPHPGSANRGNRTSSAAAKPTPPKCPFCHATKDNGKKCQPCKTAMRSVVGARCCGGLHPDANEASKTSFWKQVQNNTVHGMNLSVAMTERYDRVYKEAPELTGDCLRDVLEIDTKIVEEAQNLARFITQLGEDKIVFTSVLKHVKAIADLFCIRRFSTVATRFSKYGVARRNRGLNPTQRVEVSVKFFRHQAPWGKEHFFQRLMAWNEAQSDPGNLPSSFNEEVITAIGELGFDTVNGSWPEHPRPVLNEHVHERLEALVSLLDQQPAGTPRRLSAPGSARKRDHSPAKKSLPGKGRHVFQDPSGFSCTLRSPKMKRSRTPLKNRSNTLAPLLGKKEAGKVAMNTHAQAQCKYQTPAACARSTTATGTKSARKASTQTSMLKGAAPRRRSGQRPAMNGCKTPGTQTPMLSLVTDTSEQAMTPTTVLAGDLSRFVFQSIERAGLDTIAAATAAAEGQTNNQEASRTASATSTITESFMNDSLVAYLEDDNTAEIDFGTILDNGDKRQTGVSASRSSLGSNFGGAAVESPGRQFNSPPGALEPVPFHLTKYKEVTTPTTVAPSLLSAPALDNYFGQSTMFGMGNAGAFDQGSTYPPLYL